jgi:hypothetical protein
MVAKDFFSTFVFISFLTFQIETFFATQFRGEKILDELDFTSCLASTTI